MKAIHLKDKKRTQMSICQRKFSRFEILDIYSPAGFLIELLENRKPCSHCIKRIKKNKKLIEPASKYLKEEVYGLTLLRFFNE